MQEVAKRPDESEKYNAIPQNVRDNLMEFQRVGVKFALSRGTR